MSQSRAKNEFHFRIHFVLFYERRRTENASDGPSFRLPTYIHVSFYSFFLSIGFLSNVFKFDFSTSSPSFTLSVPFRDQTKHFLETKTSPKFHHIDQPTSATWAMVFGGFFFGYVSVALIPFFLLGSCSIDWISRSFITYQKWLFSKLLNSPFRQLLPNKPCLNENRRRWTPFGSVSTKFQPKTCMDTLPFRTKLSADVFSFGRMINYYPILKH